MDTFVRSYMDEAGFVPLPLLCTYQNVSCFGAPFYDIVEKMKVLQPDSRIEFDASNDTVRLKTGWENVSSRYSNIQCLLYTLMFFIANG